LWGGKRGEADELGLTTLKGEAGSKKRKKGSSSNLIAERAGKGLASEKSL